jgi:2-polyprenyl-6-methoxyphenol hydroxylase-like FAD-dependent oxidoreductase
MPQPQIPVLIVGAGPTGLTLACDLARRGVDFRIIDRAPQYFVGSRGKGLQPRTLEVLDDLGVVDRIVSLGRFHLPFRSYDGTTVLGDRDLHDGRHPTPDVPYASTLIIPQWRVEETLRELLDRSGKHVELATELTAIEQDNEKVIATLQKDGSQEQVLCKYLVAADGGRSFVRKHLNFEFEGETWTKARMFVGDVCVDGLDRDHWHTWPNHPDGWVGLCPFASTDSFQYQAGIASDEDLEPTLEAFQEIFETRAGCNDLKLYNPTWLSFYKVNIRMVNRYRIGRVFLAGDAAHIHSPAGGQGMNTGIQDAYNLGWKLGLVLYGGNAGLLDSYEEERLPVAAAMLGLTKRITQAFVAAGNQLQPDPATLQLGIHYRYSSLSRHDETSPLSLKAGDRAPDSPLQDARGNRLRLFDLFRGSHFTLLNIGALPAAGFDDLGGRDLRTYAITNDRSQAGAHILIDDGAHFANAYGAKENALVLVRPDGYIGWSGSNSSVEPAKSYLKDVTTQTEPRL